MSRYKPKLDHCSMVWSGSLENGVTTQLFSSSSQHLKFRGVPKETRVHIRFYTTEDDGILYPTKEGVSLKPEVWSSLLTILRNLPAREDPDAVSVIKKNVCIFNNTVDSEKCVTIQRLFQRKDNGYKLVPERVLLKGDQITRLRTSYSHIFKHVKTSLLTYTLGERISNEIKKYPDSGRWDGWDVDTPQGFDEVTNALCKFLFAFLSDNITILTKTECIDCKNGFVFNVEIHECVNMSKQQKFVAYFEQAFYSIDWDALASKFVKLNINKPYLRWLEEDLFTELDTEKMFIKMEEMFVN
ncbi:hypothetical protein AVEN_180653-1 [Araneus ventricosus]|uniref:Transcriptional coactivator p15 (PC4) C-terminal domain-containing protein n=1 Tax=Araneus ventricosus TaxID=182803 RepID=A0A4Y2IDT7_ARAVE|nr:hypothetical protein AVEN_180653-1 [Araneus ventricosus]